MGLQTGVVLLEVSKGVSVLQTRKALMEVRGLPFSLLASTLGNLRRGGRAAFVQHLVRQGVEQDGALELGARLEEEEAFGKGAPRLLDEPALRAALGVGGGLRLGPLRTRDLTASQDEFLQLGAKGWRSAGSEVCRACALLWEVQSAGSPTDAAVLANALPRRSLIALGPTDLVALRSALGRPPPHEQRWREGEYGQRRGRRSRPRSAAGCRCSSPAGAVHRIRAAQAAELASEAMGRLGLATRESTVRGRRGAPPIFSVTWGVAVLNPRKRGRPVVTGLHFAQIGVGTSLEERKLTARAEVIERASALLRVPDVTATPASALGRPYLPLRAWDLYTRGQYASPGFPFAPVTRDTPLDWVWARDAESGKRLLVPAAFTTSERLSRPRFVCASSNGVATHTSDSAALRGALLEVVERDALQLAWYRAQGGRRIDVETLTLDEGTRRHFKDAGWALHFSYLAGRADLHVIALIAEATGEGPFPKGGTLLSAAAAGDPAEAVRRSLREMRMVTEALSLPKELAIDFEALRRPPELERYWNVESLLDITLLYLNPAMRSAVELFLRSPPIPLPDRVIPDTAEDLLTRLRQDGHRTLIVDLTAAEAAPFRTYQTLILGTQPLAFGPALLRLGSGLLPRRLPPRNPELPTWPLRIRRGQPNPYLLPLA